MENNVENNMLDFYEYLKDDSRRTFTRKISQSKFAVIKFPQRITVFKVPISEKIVAVYGNHQSFAAEDDILSVMGTNTAASLYGFYHTSSEKFYAEAGHIASLDALVEQKPIDIDENTIGDSPCFPLSIEGLHREMEQYLVKYITDDIVATPDKYRGYLTKEYVETLESGLLTNMEANRIFLHKEYNERDFKVLAPINYDNSVAEITEFLETPNIWAKKYVQPQMNRQKSFENYIRHAGAIKVAKRIELLPDTDWRKTLRNVSNSIKDEDAVVIVSIKKGSGKLVKIHMTGAYLHCADIFAQSVYEYKYNAIIADTSLEYVKEYGQTNFTCMDIVHMTAKKKTIYSK